jgi:hypothetical protein
MARSLPPPSAVVEALRAAQREADGTRARVGPPLAELTLA